MKKLLMIIILGITCLVGCGRKSSAANTKYPTEKYEYNDSKIDFEEKYKYLSLEERGTDTEKNFFRNREIKYYSSPSKTIDVRDRKEQSIKDGYFYDEDELKKIEFTYTNDYEVDNEAEEKTYIYEYSKYYMIHMREVKDGICAWTEYKADGSKYHCSIAVPNAHYVISIIKVTYRLEFNKPISKKIKNAPSLLSERYIIEPQGLVERWASVPTVEYVYKGVK